MRSGQVRGVAHLALRQYNTFIRFTFCASSSPSTLVFLKPVRICEVPKVFMHLFDTDHYWNNGERNDQKSFSLFLSSTKPHFHAPRPPCLSPSLRTLLPFSAPALAPPPPPLCTWIHPSHFGHSWRNSLNLMCCSALQCAAVCCSMLHYVAVCSCVLQATALI